MLEPTGVLRSQHAAQSIAGNVQLAGFAPAPPSQLSHSSSRHICMASLISPSFHSLVRARASSCLLGLVASYPYPPQSHLCLGQSALGFLGAGMWCRYGAAAVARDLRRFTTAWHSSALALAGPRFEHSDTIIQPLPTPPGYLPQSLQAVL